MGEADLRTVGRGDSVRLCYCREKGNRHERFTGIFVFLLVLNILRGSGGRVASIRTAVDHLPSLQKSSGTFRCWETIKSICTDDEYRRIYVFMMLRAARPSSSTDSCCSSWLLKVHSAVLCLLLKSHMSHVFNSYMLHLKIYDTINNTQVFTFLFYS